MALSGMARQRWRLSHSSFLMSTKTGGSPYDRTACRAQYAGRNRDLALQAQRRHDEWEDFLHLMDWRTPKDEDLHLTATTTPRTGTLMDGRGCNALTLHRHLKMARQHSNARQQ